jgi:hypothetical protein
MTMATAEDPLTAIFNPGSGPLPAPADPNYVTAMTNLESAGGKAVACVYTDVHRSGRSRARYQLISASMEA